MHMPTTCVGCCCCWSRVKWMDICMCIKKNKGLIFSPNKIWGLDWRIKEEKKNEIQKKKRLKENIKRDYNKLVSFFLHFSHLSKDEDVFVVCTHITLLRIKWGSTVSGLFLIHILYMRSVLSAQCSLLKSMATTGSHFAVLSFSCFFPLSTIFLILPKSNVTSVIGTIVVVAVLF